MVTDPAEVFRLGTAKMDENLAFRRHLAAHHAGDKPFQVLAGEIQRDFDCTTCANCCRYSLVSVRQAEIDAIGAYLGVPSETVTRSYTVADPDAPAARILRNSAAGCVFLDGNLCAIYPARPRTCREFPYIAIGAHSLGARPSSLARWAAHCPILYNAIEAYKHRTGYHPHPPGPGGVRPKLRRE